MYDVQLRGLAWGLRTLAYGAFIAPDGSPEQAYFQDKLANSVAGQQGSNDIPISDPSRQARWNWGHTTFRDSNGPSPLHFWINQGPDFIESPLRRDGYLTGASSPWEESYLISVWGTARDFGLPGFDALLNWIANRDFHLALDTTNVNDIYLLGSYRYPTYLASTNNWIQNYAQYKTAYLGNGNGLPTGWTGCGYADDAKRFEAMAAIGFMYPYTADGFHGSDAWNTVRARMGCLGDFATSSPKWAILARTSPPRDSAPVYKTPARQASQTIPSALGWYEIPNTHLQAVCPHNSPEYNFHSYCTNVIGAWGGGIADTTRNRMIIWGGGHNDYYGNELYSLDLNSLTLTRLNSPSSLDPGRKCAETLPDGKPNSRHTYGGLSYIAHADKMYAFSGITACPEGGGSSATWTLDLPTLTWTRKDPTKGGPPPLTIAASKSDYDPVTKKVYEDNITAFYSYSYDSNTYTALNPEHAFLNGMAAVIDPVRRLFLLIGGGHVDAFSLAARSNYALQDWTSKVAGCDGLMNVDNPGLAYDPVQDRTVGWAGGNTVYLFNPATKSCTTVTYPNGPGAQQTNGTYGRFRYFPALNVFALVNDAEQDAYILRLTAAPPAGIKQE
jgi:hypothetical protein